MAFDNVSATGNAYLTGAGKARGDIDVNGNELTDSTQAVNLGTDAATSHSLTVGDTIAGGALEVDGVVWLDGATTNLAATGVVLWAGQVRLSSPSADNIRIAHSDNSYGVTIAGGADTIYFRKGSNVSNPCPVECGTVLSTGGSGTVIYTSTGSGFGAPSDSQYFFSSTTAGNGSADAGFKRSAAGVVLATNGSSGTGSLLNSRLVEDNTAVAAGPNVILAAETNSVYTNQGAAALNVHTLPTPAAGLQYTFCVKDTDGIKVACAAAGQTIRLHTTVSGSGGFIQSTTIGDCFTLTALSTTEWYVTALVSAAIITVAVT